MGLIKTAIMTGGGIYAVKQLTQAQNNRQSSAPPPPPPQNYPQDRNQQYYGPPPPPQGYWGPPPPGQEHLGPQWHPYPAVSYGGGNGESALGERAVDGGRNVGERAYHRETAPERDVRDGPPAYDQGSAGKN